MENYSFRFVILLCVLASVGTSWVVNVAFFLPHNAEASNKEMIISDSKEPLEDSGSCHYDKEENYCYKEEAQNNLTYSCTNNQRKGSQEVCCDTFIPSGRYIVGNNWEDITTKWFPVNEGCPFNFGAVSLAGLSPAEASAYWCSDARQQAINNAKDHTQGGIELLKNYCDDEGGVLVDNGCTSWVVSNGIFQNCTARAVCSYQCTHLVPITDEKS